MYFTPQPSLQQQPAAHVPQPMYYAQAPQPYMIGSHAPPQAPQPFAPPGVVYSSPPPVMAQYAFAYQHHQQQPPFEMQQQLPPGFAPHHHAPPHQHQQQQHQQDFQPVASPFHLVPTPTMPPGSAFAGGVASTTSPGAGAFFVSTPSSTVQSTPVTFFAAPDANMHGLQSAMMMLPPTAPMPGMMMGAAVAAPATPSQPLRFSSSRQKKSTKPIHVPPPARGDEANGPRQLMINYLAAEIDNASLTELLSQFGEVEVARVVRDLDTNHSRGYAFVYFRRFADAYRAVEECNGRVLLGKRLRVAFATPQREGQPGSSAGADAAMALSFGLTLRGDDMACDSETSSRFGDVANNSATTPYTPFTLVPHDAAGASVTEFHATTEALVSLND